LFLQEHSDTEWKFARTKLWMSYFEDSATLPPPFNVLPSVKWLIRIFRKSSKAIDRQRSKVRMWRSLGSKDSYLSTTSSVEDTIFIRNAQCKQHGLA